MSTLKKCLLAAIPSPLRTRLRAVYYSAKKRMTVEKASTVDIASFDQFQLAFRSGTTDERVINQFLGKNCYFSDAADYQPREDHVIIDIGAHIGAFALQAASRVPRGKVYAIEACKDTYNFLLINVALNKASNIEARRLAVSDQKGTCLLSYGAGNWGFTIASRQGRGGETVPSDTLAGFLDSENIRRCHLLKMNCEGAEFPILLSSKIDTLKRIERMVIRYHLDLWKNNTREELVSHLEGCGFDTNLEESSALRGTIVARNKAI